MITKRASDDHRTIIGRSSILLKLFREIREPEQIKSTAARKGGVTP